MGTSKRIQSLDVFRGATVAAMLVVNSPGSWSHVYWPLLHADWDGCTPTDWVFPFFLFIAGISISFSLNGLRKHGSDRRTVVGKVLKRTALIFLIGLTLNAIPRFDLESIRILGVLQRIALCYGTVALVAVFISRRGQWIFMGLLLAAYGAIMYLLPVPGFGAGALTPEGNAGGSVDRLLLGAQHLYRDGPFDPEGLVSTLTAVWTTFIGLLFGEALLRASDRGGSPLPAWLKGSALLLAGGWLLSLVVPLNKSLWSPSYLLITAGLAGLVLSLCYWVVDVGGVRRPFSWAAMTGRNPIAIFVGSILAAKFLIFVRIPGEGGESSLWGILYRAAFEPFLPVKMASLAFALTMLAGFLALAWWMDRKGIYVKI